MKDYAAISDFEISRLVGDVLGVQWANLDENYHELCYWPELDDELRIFNPCNNPADAWPIIVDSKISLHHSICKWDADSLVYDKKYKDGFFIFSSCSDIGDISSRGALRAAMIVFLMMKESEND